MGMPCGQQDLPGRIARHFDLPLQVSSFFALLILSECITTEVSFESMGDVDARALAHRLRRALDGTDIEVRSRRSIGYWLDISTRRLLAAKFGVELGVSI